MKRFEDDNFVMKEILREHIRGVIFIL